MSDILRQKYREGLSDNLPLIGISWWGGGNKKARKGAKSLTHDQFKPVLKSLPSGRYVSLQYGGKRCH